MIEPIEIHLNRATDPQVVDALDKPAGIRTLAGRREAKKTRSDESIARHYLAQLLDRNERPSVRALTAPDRPEVVPDLQFRDQMQSPVGNASLVRFIQTKASVPIFGSSAVVELAGDKSLVGVDAALRDVGDTSPIASISVAKAIEKVASVSGVTPSDLARECDAPLLTFFLNEADQRWHLAYFFRAIPCNPAETHNRINCMGKHRAGRHRLLSHMVDAHDATLIASWSASSSAVAPVVKCKGLDEFAVERVFSGSRIDTGPSKFAMFDPLLRIKTIDLAMLDIESEHLPIDPVTSTTSAFANSAAVSAHVHATIVNKFLRHVLKRDGVDGKGMELVSYVNCTLKAEQPPPEWDNAFWFNRCMWYGQLKGANGAYESYARHLDIIAHEILHGVTEFTADLVYANQSGALNESFSDIFAVIVKNWDWAPDSGGGDASTWSWEIGVGLGSEGRPLRSVSDPEITGDPGHMDQYLHTEDDDGGVHTNSNIHNKAAYHLLTMRDENGPIFSPEDVAFLYYSTLLRLDQQTTFKRTLATLAAVAASYFDGDLRKLQKTKAVRDCYALVGIT